MISIYNFTSYREFLHDYYKEQKSLDLSFSYQTFADKAGFKTKTFIYKVIKGKKALARQSTIQIARAIGFKKRETDYFVAMVSFNNVKGIDEKDYYFHQLQKLSRSLEVSVIRNNQYYYFNHWYIAVIRELVTVFDWKDDFKALAKSLNPPITPKQAKDAVTLLVDLGMIQKLPTGTYIQADKSITTGDTLKSLAIQKFQKQCMRLATEAIDRHKSNVRDISTLTVGISQKGFDKITQEIGNFRRKLVEIVQNDEPVDRVYHMNFQFFPVSELPIKEKMVKMQ